MFDYFAVTPVILANLNDSLYNQSNKNLSHNNSTKCISDAIVKSQNATFVCHFHERVSLLF